MKIRKSTKSDLNTILKLYENARIFMAAHGNPNQWGTSYPPKDLIICDIAAGHSYVCEEQGKIIATFYYANEYDKAYAKIYDGQWLDDAPGVVHRITADGTVRGTAAFCLNWALTQCGNIKIDTHRDNVVMQRALEKMGFIKCGIIYLDDGSERLAYQKRDANAFHLHPIPDV